MKSKNIRKPRGVRGKSISNLISLIVMLALCTHIAFGQARENLANRPSPHFRYVIVFDGPLHNGRLVEVLMESGAFSEKNLRELFDHLVTRFADPEELYVGVFTSLDQLPTPEEQDYMVRSGDDWLPFMAQVEKQPNAVFKRFKGNEGLKYSFGDGKPAKILILKGNNPFEKN